MYSNINNKIYTFIKMIHFCNDPNASKGTRYDNETKF